MALVLNGRLLRSRIERSAELIRSLPTIVRPPEWDYEALGQPVLEDPDERDWNIMGDVPDRVLTETDRKEAVRQVRWLAKFQPPVKNALRLYKSYVLGRDFQIALMPVDRSEKASEADRKVMRAADRAWTDFLKHNRRWWTLPEFGERVWRDGEQFTRKFPGDGWPPEVRFIDPEQIDDPADRATEHKGIITAAGDVARVIAYVQIDPVTRNVIGGPIPAEQIFHTRIDCDSTEKRGVTRFIAVRESAKMFRQMMGNEVTHRVMQSSIVLHRKITGSPGRVTSHLDVLKSGETTYPEATVRREKIRRGSILTTNQGVELEFRQPESNFSDASPLLRWLILLVCEATGWPYFMVSADNADSNFASGVIAESPVSMMVQSEQEFFRGEIEPIWWWVLESALAAGLIKGFRGIERFREKFQPEFRFPSMVTRDRLKEAQADNIGVMNGSISAQQASRNAGYDPEQMELEIEERAEKMLVMPGAGGGTLNPANNTGGNQGGPTGGHDDSRGGGSSRDRGDPAR